MDFPFRTVPASRWTRAARGFSASARGCRSDPIDRFATPLPYAVIYDTPGVPTGDLGLNPMTGGTGHDPAGAGLRPGPSPA